MDYKKRQAHEEYVILFLRTVAPQVLLRKMSKGQVNHPL